MMRTATLRRRMVPVLLLFAAGCTAAPTARNVAAFANALGTTATETRNGIEAVQAATLEAAATGAAAAYLSGGRVDLAPREADRQTIEALRQASDALAGMLGGLQAYARGLAEIAAGTDAAAAGATAKEFGSAVGGLAGEAGLAVPPAVLASGAEALGALGEELVRQRLNRDVPPIVERAHPRIVEAAATIRGIVGRRGDRGLAAILAEAESRQRINRARLLGAIQRDPRSSDAERYALFRDQWEATRAVEEGAGFGALLEAVDAMVKAHEALRSPATAETAIRNFTDAANRLRPAFQRVQRALP